MEINNNPLNVLPWVETHRPQSSDEVCGNVLAFEQVLTYGKQNKNLLLYGPPGTGKSTAVRCLLKNIPKDSKLILDAKARATGSPQHIIHKLNVFSTKKTINPQRFVLVDEVDSIRIIDQKTFIRPLTKSIGNNQPNNIIFLFICNRIERVSEFIVRNCVKIHYDSLSYTSARSYLNMICHKEAAPYDDESLKAIFNKVGNDMRKMVSTMQYLFFTTGRISFDDFMKVDPLNSVDFHNLFDNLIKCNDVKRVTQELYRESHSVIGLCIYSMHYHQKNKCLDYDYIKLLAHLCHDTHTTENTWFLIYRLIDESPMRRRISVNSGP
jgi:DNA polymerase III delta prime subunit